MAPVLLWLALTPTALFVVALLLWRYRGAEAQARRRRRGRDLLNYLDRR